uniref:Uncharacterized protein n=1 Tax=Leersia perrieri TaxID=77586 RepID=A0A0D9WRI6_9ORYZ
MADLCACLSFPPACACTFTRKCTRLIFYLYFYFGSSNVALKYGDCYSNHNCNILAKITRKVCVKFPIPERAYALSRPET